MYRHRGSCNSLKRAFSHLAMFDYKGFVVFCTNTAERASWLVAASNTRCLARQRGRPSAYPVASRARLSIIPALIVSLMTREARVRITMSRNGFWKFGAPEISQLPAPQPWMLLFGGPSAPAPLPSLVAGTVAPPTHRVARDSAHPAAVEEQLHLVLALLSRVGYEPRGRRGPGTLKDGFEEIDVDGRAAAHATRQLLGPQQRAVADLECLVPPASVVRRLPRCQRRREQLPHRRLHRADPLRAARRTPLATCRRRGRGEAARVGDGGVYRGR